MPIFDQFEIENISSYSGSYTDRYLFGSIFGNSPATNRSLLALKTTVIQSSSVYEKNFSRSETVNLLQRNVIGSRTQNLASKIFDSSEIIWNSIPVNPIGIIKNSGIVNPYLNATSSWGQIFSGSYNSSLELKRSAISSNALHCFLPANNIGIPEPVNIGPVINKITVPINKFTNTNWLYEFPFQSKFKNLPNIIGNAQNINTITLDIYSSSLPNTIISNELGSIFYAYGTGNFKRYTQNSQIWTGLGGTISFPTNISHKHVSVKSYNPLQKVYYSNYNGIDDSAYVAFGENGTILKSNFGFSNSWEQICGEHGPGNTPFISENPFEIPMEIDNWPPSDVALAGIEHTGQIGSIRDAMAIGWNDGTKDGVHLQWLLIVESIDTNGNRRGNLVRTKQARWGNKIPAHDDWEYVDLNDEFGGIVDLYSFCTKNPAGQSIGATIQQIWVVGKIDEYDEFGVFLATSALIGIGGNDGTNPYSSCEASTFTWAKTGTSADKSETIWFSTTGGKWNDRNGLLPYNWVCGLDCSTVSPTGSGYIARSNADNTNAVIQTYNPINLTNIWTNPVDVPPLYSIAYSHVSGAVPLGTYGTVICVGEGGTILRNTNAGILSGDWTKQNPDNSYSGTFVDVKKVYSLFFTSGLSLFDWIIVGDDGEIQASADDGITWTSLRTNTLGIDYPNRLFGSSSLGNVIYKSQTYGSGSKNVFYQSNNRNNSFRSYYAGSLEKTLNPSNPETSPLYTMAVGGVTSHDFNEQLKNPAFLTSFDTVLTCRVSDVSGSVASDKPTYYQDFIPEYTINGVLSRSYGKFIKSSDVDYYKCFFGYGDGFSLDLTEWQYGGVLNFGAKGKVPSFLDWSPYDVYGQIDVAQFRLYAPQIRGWKYGLYSAINTPTSFVWRRGKFGQFRDMLEQRVYTKYLKLQQLRTKRAIENPIQINFISGSSIFAETIDYVTATNPSYNLYDSGIYDLEYRSGQPFTDR